MAKSGPFWGVFMPTVNIYIESSVFLFLGVVHLRFCTVMSNKCTLLFQTRVKMEFSTEKTCLSLGFT